MVTDTTALTAFVAGLLSSAHCLTMCSGISTALLRASPGAPATRTLFHQGGRIFSYTLAGVLAGGGGAAIWSGLPVVEVGAAARTLTNVLLILLALVALAGWKGLDRPAAWMLPAWRGLLSASFAPRRSGAAGAIMAGMVWGWMPCGLVYSMLLTAMVSGSATMGGIIMAAFGVGTLPALTGGMVLLARLGHLPSIRPLLALVILVSCTWSLLHTPGPVSAWCHSVLPQVP